jgi:membrane associated rhomboid family serine protease
MFPLRDTIPSRSTPAVTILLIVANFLVFFFEISLDAFSLNNFIAEYGLIPDRFEARDVVSSMFLHGGWMHVIGNMWFLWIYGDNVEDVLGRWKYLLFYLLCGVAAAMTHVLFNAASRIPTVGASGAVAGVMGAYLIKFPHSRIQTLVFMLFITVIEVPASLILLYWFIVQLFSGVGTIGYSQVSEGGVAWFAHVGGFVAGMALVKLLGTRQPYGRRRDLHW